MHICSYVYTYGVKSHNSKFTEEASISIKLP